MSLEERSQRGEQLLRGMIGTDEADQVRAHWQEICPDFDQYVTEFLAGEIWSRPGLDLRTKSLVSIATLAGLGRTRALDLNIRMAVNNGVTREELIETFLQIAPYAGFPVCWEGLAKVREILGPPADTDDS